ncbi:PIN-like domain-containing protein [Amycolatopsis sp. NPDC004079]|uniref:PIN-like domain-containing protein n=1 Tax=Amycolatopsis sp. NPDC004079 TaxID=3154549 RepID=UPI0033BB14CD
MRSKFLGNYPLAHGDRARIWEAGTIVLDTNALLNLYRYSPDVREKFINGLSAVATRLWSPYQVAAEFHELRVGIIREQNGLNKEIIDALESAFNQVSAKLKRYKKNPVLDMDSIEKKVREFAEKTKSEVSQEYGKKFSKHGLTPQSDSVLIAVGELYDGRVGDGFDDETLAEIYKEGESRYKNKVPPGFLDSRKGGNRMYGDLVLWKEIIAYSAEKKVDVLFVTDDAKEDWWWKSQGEILGPLPDLRQEFHKETGRLFYAYSPVKFIEEVGAKFELNLAATLLDEVEDTSKRSAERNIRAWVGAGDLKSDRVARGEAVSRQYLKLQIAERELAKLRSELTKSERRIGMLRNDQEGIRDLTRHTLHRVGRLEATLDSIDGSVEPEAYANGLDNRDRLAEMAKELDLNNRTLSAEIDKAVRERERLRITIEDVEQGLTNSEFRHLVSRGREGWESGIPDDGGEFLNEVEAREV